MIPELGVLLPVLLSDETYRKLKSMRVDVFHVIKGIRRLNFQIGGEQGEGE